jgi:hypothetical protein
MTIDPVIIVAEKLRSAAQALEVLASRNRESYSDAGVNAINILVQRVLGLNDELYRIEPTSARGAAELLRVVATRLPGSHANYAAPLREVAGRLAGGKRQHDDLVWLRSVAHALRDGATRTLVRLLELSIRGAARPVLICRAQDLRAARRAALHDAEIVEILTRPSDARANGVVGASERV